jgi:hypothetical protein
MMTYHPAMMTMMTMMTTTTTRLCREEKTPPVDYDYDDDDAKL